MSLRCGCGCDDALAPQDTGATPLLGPTVPCPCKPGCTQMVLLAHLVWTECGRGNCRVRRLHLGRKGAYAHRKDMKNVSNSMCKHRKKCAEAGRSSPVALSVERSLNLLSAVHQASQRLCGRPLTQPKRHLHRWRSRCPVLPCHCMLLKSTSQQPNMAACLCRCHQPVTRQPAPFQVSLTPLFPSLRSPHFFTY